VNLGPIIANIDEPRMIFEAQGKRGGVSIDRDLEARAKIAQVFGKSTYQEVLEENYDLISGTNLYNLSPDSITANDDLSEIVFTLCQGDWKIVLTEANKSTYRLSI
jgi:hypothetical protein